MASSATRLFSAQIVSSSSGAFHNTWEPIPVPPYPSRLAYIPSSCLSPACRRLTSDHLCSLLHLCPHDVS